MEKLKNIENLYKKIFLLLLGSFLMVIPFYASSRSMLLLSDREVSWGTVHWIFLSIGVVFFIGGWAFNSIARIIVKIADNYSNKLGK